MSAVPAHRTDGLVHPFSLSAPSPPKRNESPRHVWSRKLGAPWFGSASDLVAALSFFALAFAIGAFVLARREPKPTALLRVLFGCAHALIIFVAVLGLVVASVKMP
jgi:uncharacterized PurR-regulated membrane protein YhhQ (DUF165 family)